MGAPHKKLNRARHESLPRARFQGIFGYTAEFGERTAIKLAEEEGFGESSARYRSARTDKQAGTGCRLMERLSLGIFSGDRFRTASIGIVGLVYKQGLLTHFILAHEGLLIRNRSSQALAPASELHACVEVRDSMIQENSAFATTALGEGEDSPRILDLDLRR
jgi:hypothetical protein